MDAGAEDLRVALGEGARRAYLGALGSVVHEELRLMDFLLQPPVDLVEVLLLRVDLPVPDAVVLRSQRGGPFCWP